MKIPDKRAELWKLFEETGNISIYMYYASLKKSCSDKKELNKRIS